MTAQSNQRGRGRPRDPEADTAILRATLELFIDGGVEGTSIERIAKRAEVGKLTVYRRWGSKEALIARAIETARDRIPEPQAEEVANTALPDLIERALPGLAETVADPRFRSLIARVFGAARSHPEIMETYWEHHVLPRRRATRKLLERARQEEMLPEDTDPDVLIDMMVGAVMFRLIQPGPLTTPEIRRYMEAVYRQAGILPDRR